MYRHLFSTTIRKLLYSYEYNLIYDIVTPADK